MEKDIRREIEKEKRREKSMEENKNTMLKQKTLMLATPG